MQLAQTFLLFADTRYGSSMAMFHCLSMTQTFKEDDKRPFSFVFHCLNMTQTFKEDDKRPFSFVDKVSVAVMSAVVA